MLEMDFIIYYPGVRFPKASLVDYMEWNVRP